MAMARSALGKRTRDPASNDIRPPPAKRSKRLASVAATAVYGGSPYADENDVPHRVDLDDNDDNDITFTPPQKTPSKPRRAPPAAAFKSPYPVTPSTPRHRDVFATSSPSTPRHVVMSAGKLFARLTPSTPASSSSPGAAVQTIYHSGRQLFGRGADPGQLIGREDERRRLDAFLARASTASPGGCLYVSGPPGTGKSAMVRLATEEVADRDDDVRYAYINCMTVKSPKGLYDAILRAVAQDEDEVGGGGVDSMAALQAMFLTPRSDDDTKHDGDGDAFLIVLDEIDHILTMGLDSLYKVFEWSLQPSSRLALVGIANALDLTDRHLPRLKARNLKPDLLPFLPYSSGQIKTIVTARLRTLLPPDTGRPDYVPLIHPAAIELCARKVSSQTGDLRRVFEVCRRALDLIETETRQAHENEAREKLLLMTPSRKPLGEKPNAMSPSRGGGGARSISHLVAGSLRKLTAETAPRASIGHLNKVTAAAFSNGAAQRLRCLNMQQKAALCALIANERRAREALARSAAATPAVATTPSKTGRGSAAWCAPTIRTLFEAYATLCTRDELLHPLSASEFREVVGSLEALGIVQEVDGRTGSLAAAARAGGSQTPSKRKNGGIPAGDERRIASCVAEREVEGALAEAVGESLLREILSGEALD